jgi:hypothetical protein
MPQWSFSLWETDLQFDFPPEQNHQVTKTGIVDCACALELRAIVQPEASLA